MKRCFILTFFLLTANLTIAQSNAYTAKLVVGIVVDQMRWDYFYRYYDRIRRWTDLKGF